jgi:2-methylisocitrate lyase-like PEP mutase family enzyme
MANDGLRALLNGAEPVISPLVLNPLMARIAAQAGFPALYLGGGAMGYLLAVTEANVSLPEMIRAGLEIRTVCDLPLILDGACGWGDPMHMHRTIGLAEAAGFAAIEIEDQILPKRAHHHIGIEHIIPAELMAAKVTESIRARRSEGFLIIARTNAARTANLDEALRRGEAFARAGADILFVLTQDPEALRTIAERLPGPLMYMLPAGGITASAIPVAELVTLGYRLIVDPATPLLAMHRALRLSYRALRAGVNDPTIGAEAALEQEDIHATIGLEKLLEIERRTVEIPLVSPHN